MEEKLVQEIPRKSQDLSQWYVEVIRRAELADYAPMKGMMVIRPSGYAIWENIQRLLDRRFKETGHTNAYFPLFIPESFLKKEAEHVEGFAPEVAWVTHGGQEELQERLAVRPTSEAIICAMYSKWVRSWRDLPILINQWANVVRWEKVTRPFLRTTEFLWQEGHTVHATYEDAQEEVLRILNIYKEFIENELAIKVYAGKKSDREKFAGALATYTVEALMPDGKALQAGTSHNLGQNFSKAFDIKFEDRDQKLKYAWQTSWGVSTRLVGATIMVHGDDDGLILPPHVAPYQAVIVPIFKVKDKETVLSVAENIYERLRKKFRTVYDYREEYTPGWKFAEWEMRGVPIRIEIGPRDIKENSLIFVRRDTREKVKINMDEVEEKLEELLEEVQKNLFQRSEKFTFENTRETLDYSELKEIIEEKRGFVISPWCGDQKCELKVKEETKATIRLIPLDEGDKIVGKKCVVCGKPAKHIAYFARAY
ncbi:MAG: proline--tRNA ligase [Candidatus Aminicenantes bacterium]|nr:proline--tRNA ligase [Candidatus Aminicenantes bacterium]